MLFLAVEARGVFVKVSIWQFFILTCIDFQAIQKQQMHPAKRNNNGKNITGKNIIHLLFCYCWNKFTKLNCRFLQLFTPRICGLSSLSGKKKNNKKISFSPKLEIWQQFFCIFFAHLGYSAGPIERHLQHLLRIKLRPLPHESGYFLPRIRLDGALTDSCWRRF